MNEADIPLSYEDARARLETAMATGNPATYLNAFYACLSNFARHDNADGMKRVLESAHGYDLDAEPLLLEAVAPPLLIRHRTFAAVGVLLDFGASPIKEFDGRDSMLGYLSRVNRHLRGYGVDPELSAVFGDRVNLAKKSMILIRSQLINFDPELVLGSSLAISPAAEIALARASDSLTGHTGPGRGGFAHPAGATLTPVVQ